MRVFLCDDLAEARELTRAGLEEDPGLSVVGEAGDGATAVSGIASSRADVVLLDLSMPGVDGLDAIPLIREHTPDVGIVVFSGLAAGRMGTSALGRGADRYVEKGEPFERLRRTIREVAEGHTPDGSRLEAGGELEHAGVDLDHFASAASHDLAEPLRVISGFANLLARRYRSRLDEEAGKYIDAILSGTDRMQAMIDALLAYSQVGRSEAVRTLVSSADVVRDVVEGVQDTLDEIGASVTVEELPVVAAEPGMLAELFQNLVSNAIKFRADRPLELRVEAERGEGEWRFSLSDNGIGIDPRQSERVFEMFQRLAGRDRPGTGVGLAVCKRIVERHGGRIWVEPRPGGGSVFRLTIADPVTPGRPRPPSSRNG